MKKLYKALEKGLLKYGRVIAGFAFVFVLITANSSCILPYYEPEEPKGLESFKKFNQ